jgi:hypothetical protein
MTVISTIPGAQDRRCDVCLEFGGFRSAERYAATGWEQHDGFDLCPICLFEFNGPQAALNHINTEAAA